MKVFEKIDFLQLFAEGGGDGGASAGGEGSETALGDGRENDLFANAPQKAKDLYAKMQREAAQNVDTAMEEPEANAHKKTTTEEEGKKAVLQPNKKTPFKDLIASDEYRADYERHIQRAVKDRTKRHDAEMGEVNELFSLIGQKYGLDPTSQTFRADLTKAVQADDSVYEKYAEEHDVPIEEARNVVQLKQKLERAQKEAAARKIADEEERIISALRKSAEQTREKYPDFDLDTAMQDPRFLQLTRAWGGNTTQAYESLHHSAIVREAERRAASEAKQAVANSVRSNLSRPYEGGLSSSTNATPAVPDFSSMDRKGLRAWAAEQQRKMRR